MGLSSSPFSKPVSRPIKPAATITKPIVDVSINETAKPAQATVLSPPPVPQTAAAPTVTPKTKVPVLKQIMGKALSPDASMTTNANHPDQSLDTSTHDHARLSSGTMGVGAVPTKTALANLYLRPFQSRVPTSISKGSLLSDVANGAALAEEAKFEKMEKRKTEEFFGDTSDAAFTSQDGGKLHSTESYDRYKPRAQPQAPVSFFFSGPQSADAIRKQGRESLLSRYQPFGSDAKDEFSIDADDVARFDMENSTHHDIFRADVYNPVLNEVSSFGPAHSNAQAAAMQEPSLRHEEPGVLRSVYTPLNPSAAATPNGMSAASVAALNPTVAALERRDSASQTYLASLTKQVSTLTQATVDLNRELRQLHLLSKHRR